MPPGHATITATACHSTCRAPSTHRHLPRAYLPPAHLLPAPCRIPSEHYHDSGSLPLVHALLQLRPCLPAASGWLTPVPGPPLLPTPAPPPHREKKKGEKRRWQNFACAHLHRLILPPRPPPAFSVLPGHGHAADAPKRRCDRRGMTLSVDVFAGQCGYQQRARRRGLPTNTMPFTTLSSNSRSLSPYMRNACARGASRNNLAPFSPTWRLSSNHNWRASYRLWFYVVAA